MTPERELHAHLFPSEPATAPSGPQDATNPAPAPPSTPEAATEAQEREQRYAEAVRVGWRSEELDWVDESARAVMAVADAEMDALRAEVERLRREMDGIGCSRFTCADDLGRMGRRAESAEAALAEERAKVARVGVAHRRLNGLAQFIEEECEPEGGICHGHDLTDDGGCALATDLASIAADLSAALRGDQ